MTAAAGAGVCRDAVAGAGARLEEDDDGVLQRRIALRVVFVYENHLEPGEQQRRCKQQLQA
jgi:hypothetical protein